MKALEIALLIIPAIAYALWNGRNGVEHPNTKQVINVCLIMFWSAIGIRLFEVYILNSSSLAKDWKEYLSIYSPMWAVSITGYALIFPYAFNWYWFNKTTFIRKIPALKVTYILSHLSKTAIPDRWFLKYNVHYLVRLGLYVVLFGLSLWWFI